MLTSGLQTMVLWVLRGLLLLINRNTWLTSEAEFLADCPGKWSLIVWMKTERLPWLNFGSRVLKIILSPTILWFWIQIMNGKSLIILQWLRQGNKKKFCFRTFREHDSRE